jgi:hypothetical protein
MAKRNLISIREYAKRRGCSDTAVHKAIRAGKIVKGYKRLGEKPFIDEEIANEEWNASSNPNYERVSKSGTKIFEEPAAETTEAEPTPNQNATLAAAKRAQAVYKAKLSELEYKQKAGKLVDKDAVYKALFAAGQEMRAELQSIPDRHIDTILAAKSRNEAHKMLYEVIATALTKLADIEKRDLTTHR